MLSLKEALKERRLEAFVEQEETRGIGPADPRVLEALIAEAASG
jgi:hypothetical protein